MSNYICKEDGVQWLLAGGARGLCDECRARRRWLTIQNRFAVELRRLTLMARKELESMEATDGKGALVMSEFRDAIVEAERISQALTGALNQALGGGAQ